MPSFQQKLNLWISVKPSPLPAWESQVINPSHHDPELQDLKPRARTFLYLQPAASAGHPSIEDPFKCIAKKIAIFFTIFLFVQITSVCDGYYKNIEPPPHQKNCLNGDVELFHRT